MLLLTKKMIKIFTAHIKSTAAVTVNKDNGYCLKSDLLIIDTGVISRAAITGEVYNATQKSFFMI